MGKVEDIVGWLTDIVWGPWLVAVFFGIGIYLTIGIRFIQFHKLGYTIKQTFGRFMEKEQDIKGEGTLTPRQAVSTALASTVGTGNIVGVATALLLGGPGSIFWMWFASLFGMAIKYGEIVLSIKYREQDANGIFSGGPFLYMKKGLKSPVLASIFSIALAAYLIASNMIQANAISGTLENFFNIPAWIIGLILLILVALVTLGGVKRLGKVTEKLVPFMAIFYIVGGITVILMNYQNIPSALSEIFAGAFTPVSVGGGITGFAVMEAIRFGVERGLYSNEAGMGTAPIAHAAAKTDHPARQGLWGIMEVFIDTIIVCTITSLAILTSGVLGSEESPNILASLAFGSVVPIFKYIAGISLIVFAYSTIIAVSYYGETVAQYLGGEKWGKFYRYFFVPFTFIGSVGGLQFVWSLADLLLAFAVLTNLIAIILLSPKIIQLTKDFFSKDSYREKERRD